MGSVTSRQRIKPMSKAKNKIGLAAIFLFFIACAHAHADLSYSVVDLGTLGGTTSTANGVASGGTNASGMVVGSSTMSDNTEHAFLYAGGQIFDLNTLCDLAQSDFRVLTVAKAISDSCVIIGEGITTNGDKHAFMLTPLSVDGGQWSYVCCQWCWIQEGGGWWWEANCGCYRWHGPPGRHPDCPPRPPTCWWYPLPCPRPHPTPTPHQPTPTPTLPPPVRRSPTPTPTETPNQTPTYTGSPVGVLPTPTPTYTGVPVGILPTPTPSHLIPLQPTRTPSQIFTGTPHDRVKAKATPRKVRTRGTQSPSKNTTQNVKSTSSKKSTQPTRTKGKPTPKPGREIR